MSTSKAEKVAQLKETAAKHFKQKDFVKASQLYTEAIGLNRRNATLWSNRAACRLSLHQYVGAVYDAEKAIALDPDYSKAHARLAQARDALGQPWLSFRIWAEAVAAQKLPGIPPMMREMMAKTAAFGLLDKYSQSGEGRELSEYEKNMKKWAFPPTKPLKIEGQERQHPVPYLAVHAARANKDLKEVVEYMTFAFDEFVKGLEMMTGQMTDDHFEPSSKPVFYAPKPIVVQLTEAILYDLRVWSELAAGKYLPRKFFDQAEFEAERAGVASWVESADFETIKREANQRLKREGWIGDGTLWVSGLKSALEVAVRSIILIGFVNAEGLGKREVEVEMLSRAIKLIKWGRKEWKIILKGKDLGVLDANFLRMVQSKQVQALFAHHTRTARRTGKFKQDSDAVLVQIRIQIRELADEILSGLETNQPPENLGTLKKMAYYTIPKGQASANKGFCFRTDSELADDKEERQHLQHECVKSYLAAAECFPKDDEHFFQFATIALGLMTEPTSTASAREMYDLVEQLDGATPDALYIWLHKAALGEDFYRYAAASGVLEQLKKAMAKGGLSKDDLKDKRFLFADSEAKILPRGPSDTTPLPAWDID